MRNAGLDILRLIAVLLVMGRHLKLPEGGPLRGVLGVWNRGGWVGVDLFFVLSGFLVSGLLFTEYTQSGRLDVKRFLIRRGFKIYPSFWVLLAATIGYDLISGTPMPATAVVGEVFFLQNYLGGLWAHTWSLAVEEHFYFGLAGLFWVVMVWRRGRDFGWIPMVFVGVAVACFAGRLAGWWVEPEYSHLRHLFGTHIRMDSLFYGVLLSYFYHFGQERLECFRWPTWILMGTGVLLLAPAFVFSLEGYWFVSAVGVIVFYVGSGFLVIAAMRFPVVGGGFARVCVALGAASYSIYLWLAPVNVWGWNIVRRLTGIESWYVYAGWYLVGCCVIGFLASRLIEAPALYFRNRTFPSKSNRRGAGQEDAGEMGKDMPASSRSWLVRNRRLPAPLAPTGKKLKD